jgi:hypothetical protein
MILLMLVASAALALDRDIYMPVRIDCDLVSVRDNDKSDKRTSRMSLLYPIEASKVGTGFQIYALTTLDDGRTFLKPISASSVPNLQNVSGYEPRRLYLASLDFGDGEAAFIRSNARNTRHLAYESRSFLNHGAGSVLTRGTCRMTREVDSK